MDVIGYIAGFFDSIWSFLTDTLPQMGQDLLSWAIIESTTAAIKTKLWALQMSWGIAQGVLDNLGISDIVNSYMARLDPSIAYIGNTAGIFDALNLVANAAVTRFILKTTFLGSV